MTARGLETCPPSFALRPTPAVPRATREIRETIRRRMPNQNLAQEYCREHRGMTNGVRGIEGCVMEPHAIHNTGQGHPQRKAPARAGQALGDLEARTTSNPSPDARTFRLPRGRVRSLRSDRMRITRGVTLCPEQEGMPMTHNP